MLQHLKHCNAFEHAEDIAITLGECTNVAIILRGFHGLQCTLLNNLNCNVIATCCSQGKLKMSKAERLCAGQMPLAPMCFYN